MRLRLELGYSQEALARAAGIDERTVRRAERGERVRPSTMASLALALDSPISDLLVLLNGSRPGTGAPDDGVGTGARLPDAPQDDAGATRLGIFMTRDNAFPGGATEGEGDKRPSTAGPGPAAQHRFQEVLDLEILRHDVQTALSRPPEDLFSLDDWEETIQDLGRATRYQPAVATVADLRADLKDLQIVLTSTSSPSAMRQLARITAQMAGLMRLALIDLGDQDAFRNWARTARVAATQSGDPLVHSWVRAEEAYGHYYKGQWRKAIDVARQAQLVCGDVACVGAALAAALEARALGALGTLGSNGDRETRAALARAETILSRLDGDDVGVSAFGYNEAQFHFHAGNAFTHLHDTQAAWREQEQALRLYPESDYLDRSLIALDHAYCLAYDGDVAGATTSLRSLSPP